MHSVPCIDIEPIEVDAAAAKERMGEWLAEAPSTQLAEAVAAATETAEAVAVATEAAEAEAPRELVQAAARVPQVAADGTSADAVVAPPIRVHDSLLISSIAAVRRGGASLLITVCAARVESRLEPPARSATPLFVCGPHDDRSRLHHRRA